MITHEKDRDRYVVRVYYKDEKGVTKRKARVVHSLKDAKKVESEMSIKLKAGSLDSDRFTIDDLWVECYEYQKTRSKRTTLEGYETKYERYIKGCFGDKPASELKPMDFRRWKESLPDRLALTSKKNTYVVMHMILRRAYLTHGITAIQALEMEGDFKGDPNTVLMEKEETLHYWTPNQFTEFSHALRGKAEAVPETDPDYVVYWGTYVLFNILFYAGLRRGEANALFVSDFHDGEQPHLDISKSVTHKVKGGGWFLTGPKNKSSVRKVPVPHVLSEILHEQIRRLARLPGGLKSEHYLCGGTKPINDSSSDAIKERIEKENNIEHIRVHDLRHSYVSVLINAGTPIATISKLVGHASTEMTWKVYSHMYPVTLSTAVNVFDSLNCSPSKNKNAEK